MNVVLVDTLDNNPPVMAVFQKTVLDLGHKIVIQEAGGPTPFAHTALDLVISGYPIESAFMEAGDAFHKLEMMAEAKAFYLSGVGALKSSTSQSSVLAFPIDGRTDLLLGMCNKLEFFLPSEEAVDCYRNVISALDGELHSGQDSLSERHALCEALYEVGLRLLHLGSLDDGFTYARRGLDMRRKLLLDGQGWPRLRSIADWYGAVAKSLEDRGAGELSEQLLREALDIAGEIPDDGLSPLSAVENKVRALHNLGAYYVRRGAMADGLACLEQAVKLGEYFGCDATLSRVIIDEQRGRLATLG